MQEENAYILGTDKEELFRLGLQHQIWASEAQTGWAKAGFTAGQTLLDLGCGPGFATRELAFIAGKSGKVIGVDLSKNYIEFLNQVSESHGLRIEGCSKFAYLTVDISKKYPVCFVNILLVDPYNDVPQICTIKSSKTIDLSFREARVIGFLSSPISPIANT